MHSVALVDRSAFEYYDSEPARLVGHKDEQKETNQPSNEEE